MRKPDWTRLRVPAGLAVGIALAAGSAAGLAACSGDPVPRATAPRPAPKALPPAEPIRDAASVPQPAPDPEVDVHRIPGGPQVLFMPRHSVPMVSCTVLIPGGSALETPETNGAAHYLEHLLFNGTTTRTREQIYAEADLLGAYNNASTQRERAVFQLLLPSENWVEGVELQADMLLHSTLPEELFLKEQGIILEELAKDRSDPGYEAGRFTQQAFWGDNPRALPVLGTEESIAGMDRAAVVDFYHAHYRPENMTIVLMGDFDRSEAAIVLERLYGGKGAADGAAADSAAAAQSPRGDFPTEPKIHYLEAPDLERTEVRIHLPAPDVTSPDFAAAQVLAAILSGGERSALSGPVEAACGTALSAGASVEAGTPWSVFTLAVDLPKGATGGGVPGTRAPAVEAVLRHLQSLADGAAIAFDLPAARRGRFIEEISLHEKMHYYGLMRADLLGSGDPATAERVLLQTRVLTPGAVAGVLHRMLQSGRALVTVCGPGAGRGTETLDPARYAPDEATLGQARGATAATQPIPDPPELIADTAVRRVVFRNGFTLIQHGSPESRTFAAHLLFRERSALEERGGVPRGTADVVHRIFERGTEARTEEELRGGLAKLGIQLKVTDTDWIPYDDYYFTPEYSYVRLETIDSFGPDALGLLGEIVRTPRINEETVAAAREAAATRAASSGASARSLATDGFLAALGAHHPEAGGVYGDADALRALTVEEVRRHHAAMIDPANLILCVSSSLPLAAVDRAVRSAFPEGPPPAEEPPGDGWMPAVIDGPVRVETEAGREQSWVVVGKPVDVHPDDRAALGVGVAILSERLAEDLREREGLAYSIGAGARLRGEGTYVRLAAGTRPENVERMEAGMLRIAAGLITDPPTEAELKGARNRAEGRERMRQLTRMGLAYALSMAELRGESPLDLAEGTHAALAVNPLQVRRAAEKYLVFDPPIVSVAR